MCQIRPCQIAHLLFQSFLVNQFFSVYVFDYVLTVFFSHFWLFSLKVYFPFEVAAGRYQESQLEELSTSAQSPTCSAMIALVFFVPQHKSWLLICDTFVVS